jgi:hypothetical protein
MVVTQLSCTQCDTIVLGRFRPDIFARLAPEDLDFVVHFVKNKGNVKEMERELGISYWTIRNKLNEVVEQLGFATTPAETIDEAALVEERQALLKQVENGEVSPQDAAARLALLRS